LFNFVLPLSRIHKNFNQIFNSIKVGVADLLRAKKAAKAAANLAEGEAFLAENAKKEGVVVLGNGLQYEILTAGEGAMPSLRDKVVCHYHGTLIDGKVFDSSVNRGKTATFPVNKVISGWTIALQMMSVGAKWKLYIPPHLAYGDEQVSAEIGPNSTLIFEVELIDIL
jgi:FKBP-type peptidyl-prolyl cis-trans isomerase FklB